MTGLGDALKTERKNKGISLMQISKITNISLHILRALENEQFHAIPGELHFKHFLKSYLNAIDINEKIFLREYKKIIDSVKFKSEDSSEIFQSIKYSKFKQKRLFFSILLFSVVIGIIFYFSFKYKNNMMDFFGLKSTEVHFPECEINPYPFNNHFSFDYWPVNVTLVCIENCWVQIYRGKEKIVEQIFKKGDKIDVKGYELTFTIGNSAGVHFYLNGEKITYFKDSTTSTRIYLNPNNLSKYLK